MFIRDKSYTGHKEPRVDQATRARGLILVGNWDPTPAACGRKLDWARHMTQEAKTCLSVCDQEQNHFAHYLGMQPGMYYLLCPTKLLFKSKDRIILSGR